ncbi:MAG: photosystem II reaction center protein Ycf12 [Cyanobacteria bacterium P01_F01_bin.86]
MELITNLFGGINFELVAQLTMLAMIVISGPVIVFLLVARGGDL